MKALTREYGPQSPVRSEGSAKSFQKSSEWECRAIPANYAFGPFRLDVQGEVLFRGTEPVALSHRAVALLRILIERAGAPVSKDALMEAAWPGQAVEESNLTVQIAALRRVLREEPGGERWIETLPRRGYRFVSPRGAQMENSGGIGHPPAAVLQPEPHTVPSPQPEPERRQLSILTCDLVCPGLDLEKRREAVKAFQNCVDGIAARLKGFVANHIDNTVIVYF